jgi:hypothetical protein
MNINPPFILDQEIYSGRDTMGKELRLKLQNFIELHQPPDTILPINFKNVKLISWSVADEVICKTQQRIISGELGSKYICLEEISEEVKETIEAALKLHNLLCIYRNPNDKVQILGSLSKELQATYYLILSKERITARDLLEMNIFKNKKISAASNRLKKLNQIGMIRKLEEEYIEGGGKQFVYEAVA